MARRVRAHLLDNYSLFIEHTVTRSVHLTLWVPINVQYIHSIDNHSILTDFGHFDTVGFFFLSEPCIILKCIVFNHTGRKSLQFDEFLIQFYNIL